MEESLEGTNKAPQQETPDLLRTPESDGTEYFIRNNPNYRISCSKVKDEVFGGYKVNFTKPLPQFDTAFGKAYEVSKQYDSGKLYALVLEKKHPFRLLEINKLTGRHIPHLVSVIASQLVPTSISKGRNFVVILEKPVGITLAEYIKKNGAINDNYLASTLVPIINEIIVSLSQLGVVHGKINTGNIYLDEHGNITLGECISEPCGYSQPMIYETMGRACAQAIGKGNGTTAIDYHAMGVLVAILLRGRDPLEGFHNDDILKRKFEDGTYTILTDKIEIPTRMLDLLRGILNERKLDSWGAGQVMEWIKGRRFNLLPPTDSPEAARSIVFNGRKYLTRKHLAHALYMHWDEGAKFVQTDAIIRWIDKSSQEFVLVEKLEIVSSRIMRDTDSSLKRDDELVAQYILLLDPTGPVRLREFSANIDALGMVLADGVANNSRQYIEGVESIILHNLLSTISNDEHIAMSTSLHDTLFVLQKCTDLLRKKDIGFGIERCLYELNPSLPCQSPPLIDDLVFTTEELLKCLDTNEAIGGKILDKHMAAFLSERMELPLKIFIASLTRFPDFANNIYIQILALLSLAQQTSGVGELPKLAAKSYEGLKVLINTLHSKTIRAEVEANLQKAVKRGILSNMLRVISESRYLVKDRLGFKKSLGIYRANAVQIIRLSNTRAVNNLGYRYGLQLAVMISFFVATAEFITLLIKAF